MRVIKGLFLFCFLGMAISACFDEPEYSVIPEISFKKVEFREGTGAVDTLMLYLNFKDGDGDLGIRPDELGEPFNSAFYFLADGNGDTTQIGTDEVFDETGKQYTVLNSIGMTGKLVTNETRNDPDYAYLPIYVTNDCLNYSDVELLVPADAVDNSYNIIDTLYASNPNGPPFRYYLVAETPLLYKSNPHHINIEVKFWVREGNTFVEFDWLKEYCWKFDARFPYLGGQGRALEGTMRYDMLNSAFLSTFSIKTLKLSVTIKDRALHKSNEVYTYTFKLDEIRR